MFKDIARRRSYFRKIYREFKAALDELRSQPCMDCRGVFPPYVMEFDHARGKKRFNMGKANGLLTNPVVVAELAKCDVVCANCHRIRTWKRSTERPREVISLPLFPGLK
jgi:hypothetical protein